ncbi:hypothetical protein ACFXKC_11900 [Streptomyces sp. NPDC059340]|uniref:hypothetical protein n=1 Tax=Streptomyces sp. NPDC059340 TaxID=3346806 RepID=UPI0036BB898D
MLLRLVYLAVTNTVSLIHLLPMSEREKAIEILVLRHQLSVLQRQAAKHAFTHDDRFLLAGLLHHQQLEKLRRLQLLVRPDTILRWHRDLAGADNSSVQVGALISTLRPCPLIASEASLARCPCRKPHPCWW